MRVTIENREEKTGVTGNARKYYVDCTVEFSEEEKAIIKARDLSAHSFEIGAAEAFPSHVAYVGSGVLYTAGILLVLVGFFGSIYVMFAQLRTTFFGYCFFGGIGLAIYSWLQGRKQDKRIQNPDQTVRIRDLLTKGRFTVNAINPAYLKAIEDDIRSHLLTTKALIQESAEITTKQTFEL